MGVQRRKRATLLVWAGIVLVLLGIVLAYPRLVPYVETTLYTQRIPTAPAFAGSPPLTLTPTALLPSWENTEAEDVPLATPTETPAAHVAIDASVTQTAELVRTPSAAIVSEGTVPVQLTVPSIGLEVPVVPIGVKTEMVSGQRVTIWDVPEWRAAGWHDTSARLGLVGNVVLNGHNTLNGEVFRDLYKLEDGAEIFVEDDGGHVYIYRVAAKYILREAGQPLSVRLENARYIEQTTDERLTLVTCHPYGSLANRLIIIAYPAGAGGDTGETLERMN